MNHGDYDEFWKDSGASVVDHLDEYKDIPVYHVTGWYDSWGTSVANMNFVELKKAKKSLQRLIIGP
jgi:predicted acyl esterase